MPLISNNRQRLRKRIRSKKSTFIPNKMSCEKAENLYDRLQCGSSSPLSRDACTILQPIAEKCGFLTPPNPCEGVSCIDGQHCENGMCVSDCLDAGSFCGDDSACCSGNCTENMCQ